MLLGIKKKGENRNLTLAKKVIHVERKWSGRKKRDRVMLHGFINDITFRTGITRRLDKW